MPTLSPLTRAAPRAQALAMGHGRFLAVGGNDDMESFIGPGTKVVDLSGKTVLPGFIDAHIHVLSSGIKHVTEADCEQPSVARVQEALREKANATPAGEWVKGFKYDDTKTPERRFLTKQDLDAVSVDHPVYVSHRAGHVYGINSKGLELAGVTGIPPTRRAGAMGGDPATGDLNGVIYERAADLIRDNLLPRITSSDRRAGLRRINGMLTKVGLTSVHDARVYSDELITYQEGPGRRRAGLAGLHADGAHSFPRPEGSGPQDGVWRRPSAPWVVSRWWLTAPSPHGTAYLSEPYEGSEDDHGILAMSVPELEPLVMDMHASGFQVCIHANGDATIDMC